MNKVKSAVSIGIAVNFSLFLVKLYIGVSSNSLAIYCDSINNLADSLTCGIGLFGFFLAGKYSGRQGERTQCLFAFVICILTFFAGAAFAYSGIERTIYPLPVSFSVNYVAILLGTMAVKPALAFLYKFFNKAADSPVVKVMIIDCVLDCFITACALMSLLMITKMGFTVDGIFSVISGAVICVFALKNMVINARYLINN